VVNARTLSLGIASSLVWRQPSSLSWSARSWRYPEEWDSGLVRKRRDQTRLPTEPAV